VTIVSCYIHPFGGGVELISRTFNVHKTGLQINASMGKLISFQRDKIHLVKHGTRERVVFIGTVFKYAHRKFCFKTDISRETVETVFHDLQGVLVEDGKMLIKELNVWGCASTSEIKYLKTRVHCNIRLNLWMYRRDIQSRKEPRSCLCFPSSF